MAAGNALIAEGVRTSRDDALIAQVQAGQVSVYEVLVRRYIDELRGWAVSRAPAAIDADDIVQRAFLIALERIADFQLGRGFRAWLFGIARYELATACRRLEQEQRLRGSLLQAAISQKLAREIVADEHQRNELAALRRCLESLQPAERSLLEQRYARDAGLASIATELACPTGTIKKRLYSLRQRLKRCIDRWVVEQEGTV